MSRKRGALIAWAAVPVAAAAYLTGVALVSQWAIEQGVLGIQPAGATTGSERVKGESELGPLFLDDDALMWLLLAEQGLRSHSYRVRSTFVDNVPLGREVHWSSGTIWFLQIGGTLLSMLCGKPLHQSLAIAAEWWNPIVHWGLVVSATGLFALRRQWKLALLAGITLATLPSLHFTFHTARPDHHGLQAAFVLLSFLLPVLGGLGWVANENQPASSPTGFWLPEHARRWMIAGGAAAGAGLWTGAVVEGVSLVGFGAGMLIWFWLETRRAAPANDASFHPVYWRWWGWSGAIVSLGFYLVEYFPSHIGMRMEVNHPWYAVSLAAAGEIFYRLGRVTFKNQTWKSESPVTAFAFLCLVSLPLALCFGPTNWQALRDPWMRRMHDSILEFLPYQSAFGGPNFWKTFGVLPLFLAVGIYALKAVKTRSWERGALIVPGCSALLLLVCLFLQSRWTIFFAVTIVLFAIVICRVLPAKSFWARLCYGALLLQSLLFGWLVIATARAYGAQNDPDLAASVISRRTAAAFRELRDGNEWRIFCEPGDGPVFAYYSGTPVLTSFYWENSGGLKAAVLFMTDPGDEEAKRIAQERGLTHVIVNETPEPAKFYEYVRYGTINLLQAKASLAGRLSRRQPPAWLRLDESMTKIAQQKYRGSRFVVNGKLLVYDVDRDALK